MVKSPTATLTVAKAPTLSGIGEDAALHWSYQAAPPNLLTAWQNYFAMADLQQYKAKFAWNNIRLGFYFANMYNNSQSGSPIDASTPNTTDIQTLDSVIQICADNGFQAMPCCFNFTGVPPSAATPTDLANWPVYWNNLAAHFAGDKRISLFQIANELEHSTATNAYMPNIINAVQAADPTRAIAVWNHSSSNATGGGDFPACPSYPAPSIPFMDAHIATYVYQNDSSGNRVICNSTTPCAAGYTCSGGYCVGCATNLSIQNQINALVSFQTKCPPYRSIVGEINAQYVPCNLTTVYLLQALNAAGVSYACWGYNTWRANWDVIFGDV